jgi:ankyrin repeat protein
VPELQGHLDVRAAIEHDDPARLVRLLRSGVAPVYRDQDDGWSPLHHAVDVEADFSHEAGTSRDLRLVRPLIDAGAEVNAVWTSPGGVAKTPLDIALDYLYEDAAAALRRAGGVAARDLGGYSWPSE